MVRYPLLNFFFLFLSSTTKTRYCFLLDSVEIFLIPYLSNGAGHLFLSWLFPRFRFCVHGFKCWFVLECISDMWCENRTCYLAANFKISLETCWILSWSDLAPIRVQSVLFVGLLIDELFVLSAERLVPLSLLVARGGGGGRMPGFR